MKLAEHGVIDKDLSGRLVQAAGFRTRLVHAFEQLDMKKVYRTATHGPDDLRLFLKKLQKTFS